MGDNQGRLTIISVPSSIPSWCKPDDIKGRHHCIPADTPTLWKWDPTTSGTAPRGGNKPALCGPGILPNARLGPLWGIAEGITKWFRRPGYRMSNITITKQGKCQTHTFLTLQWDPGECPGFFLDELDPGTHDREHTRSSDIPSDRRQENIILNRLSASAVSTASGQDTGPDPGHLASQRSGMTTTMSQQFTQPPPPQRTKARGCRTTRDTQTRSSFHSCDGI